MTLQEVVAGVSQREFEPTEAIGELPWRQVLGRSPARLPVSVAGR